MAEKKFSELTAKGATIADTDIVAISESAGGGTYTSKSVTGANIKALVTDANMTTTDITTNDVSTSKHGFAPKAPNDTTKFLRGDATWAVVPAGGLTKFTEAEATTSPNDTVYVDSLTAAGSTTNADIAISPKGTGAFMLDIPDNTTTGGNKRGANAIDLQTSRGAADQVASGGSSSQVGAGNKTAGLASGTYGNDNANNANFAHVVGRSNTNNGGSSIVMGQFNTNSGSTSTMLGHSNTIASGNATTIGTSNSLNSDYSMAFGVSCIDSQSTRIVNGFAAFVAGDCQKSSFYLSRRTTNNTPTTLTTRNSSYGGFTTIRMADNSVYRYKGTIIGKQSGSTNLAVWDVDGVAVRGVGAGTITMVINNVTVVSNTPAWGTPTLSADTVNGSLKVDVTGAAATNIQWTAVIETTEVIYA